jgi:hypothetical protein
LLVSLLAYITNILSYNLNQNLNETYLSTAEIRSNILKIVKVLNYSPQRATSAKINVDLDVLTTSGPSAYLLRFDKITSGSFDFIYTGQNLPYNVVTGADFSGIEFYEGTFTENVNAFTADVSETQYQEFTVADTTVGDFFELFETADGGVTRTVWAEFEEGKIYDNPSEAKIYFIEEVDTGYKVSFGNGILGKIPTGGTVFGYQYIIPDTTGDTNNLTVFEWTGGGQNPGALATITDATVTPTDGDVSSGADVKESIAEIKLNAPLWYQSQGRAVTKDDYYALALKNNDITKASIVGGDELTPIELGKVYISAKPDLDIVGERFTTAQLADLKTYFEGFSVVTIEPIVKNPEYIFLDIVSTVRYSTGATTTPSVVNTTTDIKNFINNDNDEFGDYLEYSKLVAVIDNADPITTSNITGVGKYYQLSDENLANATEDGTYSATLCKNLDNTVQTYIVVDKPETGYPVTYYEGTDYSVTYLDAAAGRIEITLMTGTPIFGVSATGFDIATDKIKFYFETTDNDVFLNANQLFLVRDADITITTERV